MRAGGRPEGSFEFFSKKVKSSAFMPVNRTDTEDAPGAFFFREYPLHQFSKGNRSHSIAHFMTPFDFLYNRNVLILYMEKRL